MTTTGGMTGCLRSRCRPLACSSGCAGGLRFFFSICRAARAAAPRTRWEMSSWVGSLSWEVLLERCLDGMERERFEVDGALEEEEDCLVRRR